MEVLVDEYGDWGKDEDFIFVFVSYEDSDEMKEQRIDGRE